MGDVLDRLSHAQTGLLYAKRDAAEQYSAAADLYEVTDLESFAKFIVAAEDFGITRSELAAELNVAPSTVGRWASGQAVPATYARGVIVKRIASLVRQRSEAAAGIAVPA